MGYRSSYLKETVIKIADKNKIELSSSDRNTIDRLNRELDNSKEADIMATMDAIKKLFGNKFKEWDYKEIGNEISRRIYNKSMF